ncbi:MAG: cupin domain-containing protein [Hamadaea sp.]|uniref:cupin domain-containing protein n=1 Tax=Hamadaea sp. TaxID=2024425 RepID=UPI001808605D|nr:cupin domain-containing protein [Hamadaea sp.]NUT18819.1 cupin domain-containing protein [Hamadaea sp.]
MTGFPGGTSISRLSVYEGQCADGLAGGTPHLHTASTEAYVVVAGAGELHTLDASGFTATPLRAGSTVWFTPGTIHRAINHDRLHVVVIMQNAGLPEAGDAVMTFPTEVVADPSAYAQAAALPLDADPTTISDAVYRRRDLAVEGFTQLVTAAQQGDLTPLHDLYAAAVALVRPKIAGWRETWTATVERETHRTDQLLDALARGNGEHLRHSVLYESPSTDPPRWGMCGRLGAHDVTHPTVLSGVPSP